MSVAPSRPRFKYPERPAPCRTCGSPSWWNGVRRVAQVVRDEATGAVRHVAEFVRRRVRCSSPSCEAADWTLYEDGGYPHRLFQLPVVGSAVATLAFERDATATAAASSHGCSRRSVSRWSAWVAGLAVPRQLARACARLDPSGAPPPVVGARGATRPGLVLRLLDQLAALLRHHGVRLRARGGLADLLDHQLVRFGDVAYLTRASPPLRTQASSLLV